MYLALSRHTCQEIKIPTVSRRPWKIASIRSAKTYELNRILFFFNRKHVGNHPQMDKSNCE